MQGEKKVICKKDCLAGVLHDITWVSHVVA